MLKDLPGSRTPTCFGKDFSDKAPECVGGYDPAFTSNNHIRPECDFVQSCAPKTQSQALIPAQNLTRTYNQRTVFTQTPPVATPPFSRPSTTTFNRPANPPTYTQQTPPAQSYPRQPVGLPQTYEANFGIPQYLTAREPVHTGKPMKRLFVEALRSMGKSVGHTIAHFFDVEIFGDKDK